jgi:hypothetical protein
VLAGSVGLQLTIGEPVSILLLILIILVVLALLGFFGRGYYRRGI